MINYVNFECSTLKVPTKGILHNGSIPFVVCPKCGATHILVDQRMTNVRVNISKKQYPQEEPKKEEEKKEDKDESNS